MIALSAFQIDFGEFQELFESFLNPFGQFHQFRNTVIGKVLIEVLWELHGFILRWKQQNIDLFGNLASVFRSCQVVIWAIIQVWVHQKTHDLFNSRQILVLLWIKKYLSVILCKGDKLFSGLGAKGCVLPIGVVCFLFF